jgi:phosphate starvation-inducible protein PhoH and related proteins
MPMPETLFFGLQLSSEQKEYADSIFDHTLTITDSISGSGKTTIAVGCAKLLKKPLYYFFAPVQEDVYGYTPGDLEEKESKYLVPLLDALKKINEEPHKAIFSKKEFRPHAWVHATSHAFWRGGNIENATVILDETQNWTKHEIKKVLTRCHDNCTVIMVGHQGQIDIPTEKSGFSSYIEHAKGRSFVKQVNLTTDFRGRLARWADQA